MSIEQKVRTALAAVMPGGRVYPVVAPQGGVYPSTVYQVIAAQREGNLSAEAYFTTFRIQVDVMSADFDEVLTMRASALAAIRALPEYIPGDDEIDVQGFDETTRLFFYTLDFRLRDAD